MLKSMGSKYVFIGHSERKKYFGETDEEINKKILACYRNGLIPIILVGETEEEKEKGLARDVIKKQLTTALKGMPKRFMEELVLVYEPVWGPNLRGWAA